MSVSLLVGANDLFFMSLMFFLSGLFVWHSLQHKGAARFLGDRARRLGVPFVAGFLVLAPIAYYPTYLATTSTPTLGEFLTLWTSLGVWPAGPAWFLWVSLAFDALATAMFALAPATAARLSRLTAGARLRPGRFVMLVVALSLLAYLPMVLAFDAISWAALGPFTVQTGRVPHTPSTFCWASASASSASTRGCSRLTAGWRADGGHGWRARWPPTLSRSSLCSSASRRSGRHCRGISPTACASCSRARCRRWP